MESKLLQELHLLLRRKPPESAPPSAVDEFHLKLQELFGELITKFPVYAVGQKLELEMWNTLYKSQLGVLQQALGHRSAGSTGPNGQGQPRTAMELKLRFVLLLDRASGVYLTLVQRLLHSLPDLAWPKLLLSTTTSLASPTGLFKFGQLGRTCGRFDLDLATFSALDRISATVSNSSRWLERRSESDPITSLNSAPRILSRGDRLPTVQSEEPDHEDAVGALSVASPFKSGDSATNPPLSTDGIPSTEMDSPIPSVDHSTAVNYLVQHCLVHLGDIARYRQQLNVAAGYYLWGWIVHPDSGHPFNQLAILESSKGAKKRPETLFYYYVRAIACQYPFPAASTNLMSMLRNALPSSTRTKVSASLDANTLSTVRQEKDPRQLLFSFYTALQLCSDASNLVVLANEFSNAIEYSPQDNWTASDSQSLIRLVTLHIHLLVEHTMDLQSPHVTNTQSPKSEVGRMLLLHCTVRLCDWIARQCLVHTVEPEAKQHRNPILQKLLSSLSLLFLWLRQKASVHSVSIDAAFRIYAPPLSKEFVSLLNSILHTAVSIESDTDSSLSHSYDELNAELNWKHLLRLPEIFLLQGFQPLQVPTQQHMFTTESQIPVFPFRLNRLDFGPATTNSLQTKPHPSFGDEFQYFCFTPSLKIAHQRLHFLLTSARIIAREYPALLAWSDGDVGPEAPSFRNGQFRSVSRRAPVLAELIIPSHAVRQTTRENTSHNTKNLLTVGHVEAQKTVDDQVSVNSQRIPIPTELRLEDNATDAMSHSVPIEHTQEINGATSTALDMLHEAPPIAVNQALGEPQSELAVILRPPTELVEWTATSLNSTTEPQSSSNPVDTSRATTTTTSGSASGGLIVNAELAKFIQEQASQVAARQQRAERSTLSTAVNGDQSDATGRTSSATGDGQRAGKANSSRLCLSAAFRRDLPPRFARRLQAELLEREAQDHRLGFRVDAESTENANSLTSSLATLNLDQPAPLARKESEAPLELNSLLSTTGDPTGSTELVTSPALNVVESGTFSSVPMQPALSLHHPHFTASSAAFLTSIPNASLDISPRSYVAHPLPMYPPPPLPLSLPRPHLVPDFNSFQTPPPSVPSVFAPPRPSLYDWHPPNPAQASYISPHSSMTVPPLTTLQPIHSTLSNPILSNADHHPPSNFDDFTETVGLPAQYRAKSLGLTAEYNAASATNSMATDTSSFIPQSLLMDTQGSMTTTNSFIFSKDGIPNSSMFTPAATSEQEPCFNLPPVP